MEYIKNIKKRLEANEQRYNKMKIGKNRERKHMSTENKMKEEENEWKNKKEMKEKKESKKEK